MRRQLVGSSHEPPIYDRYRLTYIAREPVCFFAPFIQLLPPIYENTTSWVIFTKGTSTSACFLTTLRHTYKMSSSRSHEPETLVCPFCGYRITQLYVMQLHIESFHTPDSPFVVQEEKAQSVELVDDEGSSYVLCPEAACGEPVFREELQTHLDMHLAERVALTDFNEVTRPQTAPSRSRSSSRPPAPVSSSGSSKPKRSSSHSHSHSHSHHKSSSGSSKSHRKHHHSKTEEGSASSSTRSESKSKKKVKRLGVCSRYFTKLM